jgi:hypothetical protein
MTTATTNAPKSKTPEALADAGMGACLNWLQTSAITAMEFAAASALICSRESTRANQAEKDAEEARKNAANGAARKLSLKVSEKGCVSLSGINARFPVSLYADQWERVLAFADEIRDFIRANKDKLPRK